MWDFLVIIHIGFSRKSPWTRPPSRSSHRDGFSKYLFFFSRSNLLTIFQESLSVRRIDTNFPGGFICSSNRHFFFQEGLFSHRTYSFSRKPYLVLKHILFFRRPLCLKQIGLFQEGTPPPPPSNRYFVNRSRWLL